MQFVNIVVHSVENMNFRVHLQYEFTQIGLDDYLNVSIDKLNFNNYNYQMISKNGSYEKVLNILYE